MTDITKSQDWTLLGVDDLERAVLHHNRLYWVENAAVISDPDFDRLVEALRDKAPNSAVLDAIGPAGAGAEHGEVAGEKVAHDPPMLSLDKCYDEETLLKWFAKFEGDAVVTPKVDGVAVCIRYDDTGALSVGSTRGNGTFGELITENVKHIVDVPVQIEADGAVEVRGEAYMPWSVFNRKFAADYSSPRNLTAGALKQKVPAKTAHYEIRFFAYDVIGREFDSESDKLNYAGSLGFTAVDHDVVKHENLQSYFEGMESTRGDLDYDTDGVVYKANDTEEQERMGHTAHHPRFAIAYKYQGDSGVSVLRDVLWSVSRTGAINPVGIVDPIELSGATVTRVSLHNLSIMAALGGDEGMTLNSKVVMVRRGGVIPHMERVVEHGDVAVELPTACPFCSAPAYRDGDVLMAEHADDCRATRIKRLEHYASVLEMKGFGPKILEALFDAGLLNEPVDFYTLTVDDMMDLDRVGKKTATTLTNMVDDRRRLPVATFLRGLGIDELGKHVGKILAQQYDSIEAIMQTSAEELAAIHTIGDVIADKVTAGLAERADEIEALLKYVELEFPVVAPIDESLALNGKSFLFTGALESMSRKEAQSRVTALGGDTPSGVKKDLDYLVIGDADLEKFEGGWRTSKLKKAESYNADGGNIAIIGESQFLELLSDD